jgi:hypothetical protein
VRPSLADLLKCRSIPGAKWDIARKGWVYPSNIRTARLIRSTIRRLNESKEFKVLLDGAVAVQGAAGKAGPGAAWHGMAGQCTATPVELPVAEIIIPPLPELHSDLPVPEALVPALPEIVIDLPEGLLTKPWRHQLLAFLFCLDHFRLGLFGLLLAMGMGTGKTLVAIMLMLHLKARRAVIACPLRVVPVWVSQIAKHCGVEMLVVALDESAGSVAQKRDLAAQKIRLAEARGVPFVDRELREHLARSTGALGGGATLGYRAA